MIPYLSEKITSSFIANNIIQEDDYKLYLYSFEILLSTVLNVFAICIIAVATKTVLETLCYFIAFIPLRQFAGGYHAKNHIRCFVILMVVYIGFLMLINVSPMGHSDLVVFISVFISLIIVFFLAPVADINKPLNDKEIIRFRYKSRLLITVYSVGIILINLLITDSVVVMSLALGVLSIALSLITGKVKNMIENHSLSNGKS